MIEFEELSQDEDYKRIIQAVVVSAIYDYTNHSHPKNRDKRYLEQSYRNSINMIFDDNKCFDDLH